MDMFLRRNRFGLSTLRKIHSKMNNNIKITNDDVSYNVSNDLVKVFTWGNIRNVPSVGEIHNHPDIVSKTANKGNYRQLLSVNGIRYSEYDRTFVGDIPTTTKYNIMKDVFLTDEMFKGKKFILRPPFHHGASDFHVLDWGEESIPVLDSLYEEGWYMSEYIPKVQEFRVFIMHNRVLFVIEKLVDNIDDYAWNVANGGSMVNVRWGSWNKNVIIAAFTANRIDGLQYGAYDIMLDENGTAYVLEVNTSPRVEEEYWSSCVAKAFDYAIDNDVSLKGINVNTISLIYSDKHSLWRNALHPSLSDEVHIPGGDDFSRYVDNNDYSDDDYSDDDYYDDDYDYSDETTLPF